MPQTKVLGVTIVESKALTKLLKVRMVINQTQSHQRIQQLEKRDCNCAKICTPQRWPLIFFFFFWVLTIIQWSLTEQCCRVRPKFVYCTYGITDQYSWILWIKPRACHSHGLATTKAPWIQKNWMNMQRTSSLYIFASVKNLKRKVLYKNFLSSEIYIINKTKCLLIVVFKSPMNKCISGNKQVILKTKI